MDKFEKYKKVCGEDFTWTKPMTGKQLEVWLGGM
ncbi:hypothetical protein CCACVL1_24856 [Corchorus capsularis]|uniref:Uncharacterized protein n=1 Tax=Corchorus capsularis TaxID=210143 RepID=A0A1R3GMQ7_COCAP|nr:hypothetical protein CCACVL1_24856 [Corchorus capsularis]